MKKSINLGKGALWLQIQEHRTCASVKFLSESKLVEGGQLAGAGWIEIRKSRQGEYFALIEGVEGESITFYDKVKALVFKTKAGRYNLHIVPISHYINGILLNVGNINNPRSVELGKIKLEEKNSSFETLEFTP